MGISGLLPRGVCRKVGGAIWGKGVGDELRDKRTKNDTGHFGGNFKNINIHNRNMGFRIGLKMTLSDDQSLLM